MFNKILLSGVACAALLAGTSVIAQTKPAAAHSAHATAKPELGAWGVDLSGMDKTANPGDSWYN
jgi:putative endopeptidase